MVRCLNSPMSWNITGITKMYYVWEWVDFSKCIFGKNGFPKVYIINMVKEPILSLEVDSQRVAWGSYIFDLEVSIYQGQVVNV